MKSLFKSSLAMLMILAAVFTTTAIDAPFTPEDNTEICVDMAVETLVLTIEADLLERGFTVEKSVIRTTILEAQISMTIPYPIYYDCMFMSHNGMHGTWCRNYAQYNWAGGLEDSGTTCIGDANWSSKGSFCNLF